MWVIFGCKEVRIVLMNFQVFVDPQISSVVVVEK